MTAPGEIVVATILDEQVWARVVDETWTPRFNAQDARQLTIDVDGVRFVVSADEVDPDDALSRGRGLHHRGRADGTPATMNLRG